MLEAIARRDEGQLEALARSVPSGLAGMHGQLLDAGLVYPGFLYREADSLTRDRLLAKLADLDGTSPSRGSPETTTIDHVLNALAWIGDDEVQRRFAAWRSTPPSWASAIYAAAHDYSVNAGWTLRTDGTRRDLWRAPGRAIVRAERASGPLRVLARHAERCRYCSHPLGLLFDLDVATAGLSFAEPRLMVPFCHHCSAGDWISFRIDHGGVRWHEANPEQPPVQCDYNPWDEGTLVLGPVLSSPFECHGWNHSDLGHVGGVPGWIHDTTYPECPDCRELPTFVGQLAVASGGRFYAFLCEPCRVVATTYQQT